MFSPADAQILLAISSPAAGCPIPEIYWRVDFLNRSVPAASEICMAVEKGLRTGLLGCSSERLVLSPSSRKTMLEIARASGSATASRAVAAWLNQEFDQSIRSLGFELIEERDDAFRYGIASVEWKIVDGTAEMSDIAYTK